MSASSDDTFHSAPDSFPSNSNFSQTQQQPLSTPINANLDSRADQNQHLMPPPDKWLLRIASSAGQVISSVLGLSDGSSSGDESDGDVAEMPSFYEEKYEFGERIKKLNQVLLCALDEEYGGTKDYLGMALGQVEEPNAIIPLAKFEELVTQETISRGQSRKMINLVQSQVMESSSPFVHPKNVSSHNHLVQVPLSPVQASLEIHSVTVSEAKKWSEENKSASSSFTLPLNPNISPSPGQTQQLPLASTNPSLNSNIDHCLSPSQNYQQPFTDIIPPVEPSPSPSPSPRQNKKPPLSNIIPPVPVNPLPYLSPGQNQQSSLPNIIPPVNPLPSPFPAQNQPPPLSNIVPPVNPLLSSSLSKNQQQPYHSAPPLNPNAAFSSTNQKQKSPHSSIPSPERQSKPRFKRTQPSLKCPLTSSNHKLIKKETQHLIFNPMVEEGSGAKRMPSNLKEVIELFSGDLDAKQLVDMDLLDALAMKGITFEDPPWWPK